MRKAFDINGSAPRRSKIKLIGPTGRMIGETEADSFGDWIIRGVTFDGPGDHNIHARVRTPTGGLVCSEDITVHVESPEEIEQQAEERERALALYEQYTEAFAAGHDVDAHTITEVCQLAGRTIYQFSDDVTLIRELAEQDAEIEARLRGTPC